jgi:hypothetical protein
VRPLLVALAALVLAAPAAAAEPEPVTWDDPCGDAAPSAVVAGQRQALPGKPGLDLRSATLLPRADVLRIELRTCGPVDTQPGSAFSVRAALPDGCAVEVLQFERVDLRDPASPRSGPGVTLSRDCAAEPVFQEPDESITLPGGTVRGDLLAIDVPRSALGGLLGRGVELEGISAGAADLGVYGSGVFVGNVHALGFRSGTLDTARGPARLTLG